MANDLYFNITPQKQGVQSVLFGKESAGYRIYAKDTEGQSIWHYDQIQDYLDHILPDLAELIGDESKWFENDTGKLTTAWASLASLSAATFS